MGLAFPKPPSRAGERRARRAAKDEEWTRVRRLVLARDGRRCRVCHSRRDVEAHHIRFRSRGGEHTTANVACVCAICHADIHAYRLTLSGNADGIIRLERAQ